MGVGPGDATDMPAVRNVRARALPPGTRARARVTVAAVGGHGAGARADVREVPVRLIRRPLHGARPGGYDQAKIKGLMESIEEVGLLEPIDVLEVAMDDGSTVRPHAAAKRRGMCVSRATHDGRGHTRRRTTASRGATGTRRTSGWAGRP